MTNNENYIIKDTKKKKEYLLTYEGEVKIDKKNGYLTIHGDWDPYKGEDKVIISNVESAKILKEALEDFIKRNEEKK